MSGQTASNSNNIAYPEYKDSGVEWLGLLPNHWQVKRLGQFLFERREKCSDKDYEALSVTKNGIVPQLETVAKTDAGDNRKRVHKGDFVINSRSDRKGSSGLSSLDGSVSLISIVLEPVAIHGEFVHHLLRSYPFQEEFYRYGKGIVADLWSTNYSEMKNISLPIPSAEEQRTIAAFLDYETARIDSLIDKQQRLIELLKEKRQAVISHAVTKGLNPDAPMKDSGVEWLGQVPEHWVVGRVKHLSQVSGGYAFSSSDFVESGVQLIKIGNLYQSRLQLDRDPTFLPQTYTESHSVFLVRKGDLLMSLTGTLGKRDYGFAVEYASPVVGLLNQRVAKFLPDLGKVDKGYLLLVLLSDNYLTQIYAMPSGTKQANLSSSDVLSPWVCFPSSKEEQSCIVKYVQERTAKLDSSVDKAEIAIKLLQERRTALISAAVTGKIDLRGWTPPREG